MNEVLGHRMESILEDRGKRYTAVLSTSFQWDQPCRWPRLGAVAAPMMKVVPSLPAVGSSIGTRRRPLISMLVAWVLTLFNRLTRCSSILAFGDPHLPFSPSHWLFRLSICSTHVAKIHHLPRATCGNRNQMEAEGRNMFAGMAERTLKVKPHCEKQSNSFSQR